MRGLTLLASGGLLVEVGDVEQLVARFERVEGAIEPARLDAAPGKERDDRRQHHHENDREHETQRAAGPWR